MLVLLNACTAQLGPAVESAGTAPSVEPSPTADLSDWPFVTTTALGQRRGAFTEMDVARRDPMPQAHFGPMLPPPPPEPSPAARILPSLTGGTFDRSYGAALEAAIAALPDERRALGMAGIDSTVLSGLCEDPHVRLVVDGHEASVTMPWGGWFAGFPAPDEYPLPPECVDALLGPDGVDNAECEAEDVQAHFPEGSDCRDCLLDDGDHARCIDEAACRETAMRQIERGRDWHGVLRVPSLLCAPDHVADAFVLVKGLTDGDPLPQTFDHGAVAGLCYEAWVGDAVGLVCSLGDYNALGDVLYSRVEYIRPVGDTSATPWAGRISLVGRMEVEGWPFAYSWLFETGGTAVSAPSGSVPDGWGVNPRDLRADGVDPTDPEHTLAREYVASFSLKMMTTRDGIIVNPINHNRCAEADWRGPHADGTYSCDRPGPWSPDDWADDAFIAWWDQPAGEIYGFPLVTLASTGLPDPDVAGGLLTEVFGSTTLADAEWEACAWPKTFVPDRVRLYDPTPVAGESYAAFDGQTYRLGRDPDVDVRLFLATNQLRDFCPEQ